MFNFFQKSDSKIEEDVLNELKWDPSVPHQDIGVSAKDGIVLLRGSVPHYFEKRTAEEATERVGGVRGVADEIQVKLREPSERSDQDIAASAVNALAWDAQVPPGFKVTVDKAVITLRGNTDWDYQRNAARKAVSKLMGVRGVINKIQIKDQAQPADIQKRIEQALVRSAEREGRKIRVCVDGSKVTLEGDVNSISEIGEAGFAAFNAPGVVNVENNLRLV